jgi:putative ABC transport system substrate-binding protein
MRRREVITFIGGAVATWPLAARAQEPATKVIGWLGSAEPKGQALNIAAFKAGLGETGHIEGRDFEIEYRWAEDDLDRLPALAADLVRRRLTTILANGPPAAVAAKAATSEIPIVFVVGFDPVEAGIVSSINRPGGNLTGMSLYIGGLVAKKANTGGIDPHVGYNWLIVHPQSPTAASDIRDAQAAATLLGRRMQVFNAKNEGESTPTTDTTATRRRGCSGP